MHHIGSPMLHRVKPVMRGHKQTPVTKETPGECPLDIDFTIF